MDPCKPLKEDDKIQSIFHKYTDKQHKTSYLLKQNYLHIFSSIVLNFQTYVLKPFLSYNSLVIFQFYILLWHLYVESSTLAFKILYCLFDCSSLMIG